jgi:hypothetical protein
MHDTQYREAISFQNSGYNQPPHPSFFLGAGMADPPTANIYTVAANPTDPGDFNFDDHVDDLDLDIWERTFGSTQPIGTLPGDGNHDGGVNGRDVLAWLRGYGNTSTTSPVQASPLAAVAAPSSQNQLTDAALTALATEGLPGECPSLRPLETNSPAEEFAAFEAAPANPSSLTADRIPSQPEVSPAEKSVPGNSESPDLLGEDFSHDLLYDRVFGNW